jgi:hypothetical protein
MAVAAVKPASLPLARVAPRPSQPTGEVMAAGSAAKSPIVALLCSAVLLYGRAALRERATPARHKVPPAIASQLGTWLRIAHDISTVIAGTK